MHTKEIYTQIDSLIKALRQEVCEKDNIEQWILLEISRDENLICDICFRYLNRETVYISAPNETKKVLCEKCWEKEKAEEKEI